MQLGTHHLPVPILQGGMGVGVSLGRLAGSVAACGGMGTISTADVGFREPDFDHDPLAANLRALRQEIQTARTLSKGNGMIAINAMVATRQYADAVKTAVDAGIDAVVSGAGLPLELPALTAGSHTSIAPIVSSGRAAQLILKTWDRRYQATADFVVLEGAQAGGHLGFREDDLLQGRCPPLDELLPAVLESVRPYEQRYGHSIPVFVAGGVYTSEDIAHYRSMGAAGAQLATRFITTYECDAAQEYKDVFLQASAKDLSIIHSPVGMPGRAIRTPLVQRLDQGHTFPPKRCSLCMSGCQPQSIPFCITHALIEAVKGNVEDGLFFSGGNVEQLDRMYSVAELMDELTHDWSVS